MAKKTVRNPESGQFEPAPEDVPESPEALKLQGETAVDTASETDGETGGGTGVSPSKARPRRLRRRRYADEPEHVAPQVEELESQVYESEPDKGIHVIDGRVKDALRELGQSLGDGALATWRVAWWKTDEIGKTSYICQFPLSVVMKWGIDEFAKVKFNGGNLRWALKCGGRYASKKDIPPSVRESMPVSGHIDLAGKFRLPQSEQEESQQMVMYGDEPLDIDKIMDKQASAFEKGMELASSKDSGSKEVLVTMMSQMQQNFQFMMKSSGEQFQVFMEMMRSQRENSSDSRDRENKMWERFIDLASGMTGGDKTLGHSILEALPSVLDKTKEIVTAIPAPVQKTAPQKVVKSPEAQQKESQAMALTKLIEEIEMGHESGMPPDLLADTLSFKISKLAPWLWQMVETNTDEAVIAFLGNTYSRMRGHVWTPEMQEYVGVTLASIRVGLEPETPEEPEASAAQGQKGE